nr:unnamed protein product [Callosobruchus analis]
MKLNRVNQAVDTWKEQKYQHYVQLNSHGLTVAFHQPKTIVYMSIVHVDGEELSTYLDVDGPADLHRNSLGDFDWIWSWNVNGNGSMYWNGNRLGYGNMVRPGYIHRHRRVNWDGYRVRDINWDRLGYADSSSDGHWDGLRNSYMVLLIVVPILYTNHKEGIDQQHRVFNFWLPIMDGNNNYSSLK